MLALGFWIGSRRVGLLVRLALFGFGGLVAAAGWFAGWLLAVVVLAGWVAG